MRAMLMLVVLFSAVGPALAGGEITLRRAARVGPSQAITLGDVARFGEGVGDEIGSIRLVLNSGESRAVRVGLRDVEHALREAGVDSARFAMSGSTCIVRRGASVRAEERRAEAEDEGEGSSWHPPEGADTFHDRIVDRLAASYGVDRADIRIDWQSRDHEFLERRHTGGRMAVELVSNSGASRAAILVRLWRGDSIAEERTIRADVRVRRRSVVMARTVSRGDVVDRGDVRYTEAFARPGSIDETVELSDVVGMVARTRLDGGDPVRPDRLEPPVLVERGQMVVMYCVRGRIEVRLRVRAEEDGTKGQVIEVSKADSRETIYARVDGRGLVTIGGDGSHERIMR